MLPAEQPDATAAPTDRPRLAIVAPATTEVAPEPDLDPGLVRSAVVGGLLGFAVVFALVCGGLLLNDMDLVHVLPSATFVAAFGGVGFGAMQAAALHKPRSS